MSKYTVPDYYRDIDTPDAVDMSLQLQQLVQQGVLSPEDAEAALAGESALGGITLDPALKQKQMASLAALQEIADGGGRTLTDDANLNRIQSDINTQERGAREAIVQNAEQRGMGGSGLSLMSQMKNQQDSATRSSQGGLDIAAQAQDRALQSLIQGGNMAGDIRGQEFGEQAQIAGAQDSISKFNAQALQQTNLANTAARNNAQQLNLQTKQNISNANADTRNKNQQYNKQLEQQAYENKLKKAAGQSGIAMGNAGMAQNQDNADRDNTKQLIGAGLTAAAMFSDERGKCDVEEFDPSDFLDSLTGYKYQYKDKKHGEGEHVGVMAQDLEKTEAGSRLVADTPEGKVVDYGKSGPQTFASLANLNERLKKLEGA